MVHRIDENLPPRRLLPERASMAVDERARHELYQQAEAAMGQDSADTLMSLLPPVGWADVATRQDLDHLAERLGGRIDGLEQRMDARFDAVDARFDAVDARFDAVDARFEGLTHQIRGVEDRVLAAMRQELNNMVLKMFALVVALVAAVAGIVVPLVTLT